MTGYLDEDYSFSTSFLPPLVMAKHVPSHEGATASYVAGKISASKSLPLNMALVEARELFDKFKVVGDYERLFVTIPKPNSSEHWSEDWFLGEQMISGLHPDWIQH